MMIVNARGAHLDLIIVAQLRMLKGSASATTGACTREVEQAVVCVCAHAYVHVSSPPLISIHSTPKNTQDRRAALGMVIGAASLAAVKPSKAAYGEGANVFGRVTNKTGFVPYAGDSFALLIPSKW